GAAELLVGVGELGAGGDGLAQRRQRSGTVARLQPLASRLRQNHRSPEAALFGRESGRALSSQARVIGSSGSPVRLGQVRVGLDQTRSEMGGAVERSNTAAPVLELEIGPDHVVC